MASLYTKMARKAEQKAAAKATRTKQAWRIKKKMIRARELGINVNKGITNKSNWTEFEGYIDKETAKKNRH